MVRADAQRARRWYRAVKAETIEVVAVKFIPKSKNTTDSIEKA